jgi:uncharacterized protein (TIRG00374 family)
MKTRLFAWLRVMLGVALAVFVIRSLGDDAPSLLEVQGWVAAFAALAFFGGWIEALRLRILLGAQGIALPFGLGFRLVAIGAFFSLCIPGGTGGDVMKVYYLASLNPDRKTEAATIVVLDRLLAMWALLVFIVVMAFASPLSVVAHPTMSALVIFAGVGALGLLVVGAICIRIGERFAARCAERVPRLPGLRVVTGVLEVLCRYRPATLIRVAGLSIMVHAIVAIFFVSMAHFMLGADGLLSSAARASLGMLANAIPVTPGGIGVGEAAFEQLFALGGVAGGAMLILSWRFGMLPICLLGLVFYVFGVRREKSLKDGTSARVNADGAH